MPTTQVDERMQSHSSSLFYHEHVARYGFADRTLGPGLTLDIATGSGYGAWLLGQGDGRRVIAADVYPPTLAEARRAFNDPVVTFMAANGTQLPLKSGLFPNVVSLETIEHIHDGHAF